jgi:hypothetical protein
MSQGAKTIDHLNPTKPSIQASLKELWQKRQQVVLTINGQHELLVQDAASYALLLEFVERLETIDSVKRSMEVFERGEGRPAREALEGLGQKYGISS